MNTPKPKETCFCLKSGSSPNTQYIRSCHDSTIAGVWRQATAASSRPAPFSKVALSKLLMLRSRKEREDYFRQQADFVTAEGQADELAEFSTTIDGTPLHRSTIVALSPRP